jgi:hypothetical protein
MISLANSLARKPNWLYKRVMMNDVASILNVLSTELEKIVPLTQVGWST